jgi:poly-gamma-glutamate synthesis protein (capsule biosynthesis protein)
LLEEANIAYAGAGKNAVAARQPAILERGGLSIAFLAYNDTDVVPDSYSAESERPGTVFMDIDPMKADVAMAKNLADLVIVSMHSGTEYQSTPNRRQEEFARAAVDAGADLIIGHHPHVVQTVERYHGKYIVYSLGNFIFDQMWSRETREGMTLRVTMDGSGVTDLQFIPVVIDDYAQPRPATAVEAEPILKRLGVELDSEGRIAQST